MTNRTSVTDRDDFIAKVRTAAAENAGKPLGEPRFYQRFQLGRNDLWNAGFESYGAACAAADLQPNTLQRRLTDDEVLRPLALLARRLSKFPSKGAAEVERKRDAAFPSWESLTRRAKEGPQSTLREVLHAWCEAQPEFGDVAALLQAATREPRRPSPRTARPVVNGFVYLMRYGTGGSVYKIGITDNVPRRHAQIRMMAPQDVRVVHSIPTDDPAGIERYWHERFQDKVVEGKKELFRLTPDDVAAFRSRKYQ